MKLHTCFFIIFFQFRHLRDREASFVNNSSCGMRKNTGITVEDFTNSIPTIAHW